MRLAGAFLASALMMVAAPAVAVPPPPAPPPGQADWTQRIERTAEGGYRMGNPDAPVQVVEFISLTCPHCASFAAEGMPALIRDHVRSGRVSIELRNFVLNQYDVAAAVLSRCVAPERYFALTDELFRRQSEWTGRASLLSPAQLQQLQASPETAVRRIAELLELGPIAATYGLDGAAATACLSDNANLEQVLDMREAGIRQNITGTPSFLVNGRRVDAYDWASLQPHLTAP